MVTIGHPRHSRLNNSRIRLSRSFVLWCDQAESSCVCGGGGKVAAVESREHSHRAPVPGPPIRSCRLCWLLVYLQLPDAVVTCNLSSWTRNTMLSYLVRVWRYAGGLIQHSCLVVVLAFLFPACCNCIYVFVWVCVCIDVSLSGANKTAVRGVLAHTWLRSITCLGARLVFSFLECT